MQLPVPPAQAASRHGWQCTGQAGNQMAWHHGRSWAPADAADHGFSHLAKGEDPPQATSSCMSLALHTAEAEIQASQRGGHTALQGALCGGNAPTVAHSALCTIHKLSLLVGHRDRGWPPAGAADQGHSHLAPRTTHTCGHCAGQEPLLCCADSQCHVCCTFQKL